MGASVAGWANISGEPPAVTSATTAALRVEWSRHHPLPLRARWPARSAPETPVATPISLTGLTAGSHSVRVIGKNSAGVYQDVAGTPATVSRSWTVTPGHVNFRINEVLAINTSAVNHEGTFPDVIELFNYGPTTINLAGMAITDDPTAPGKFVIPVGTTLPTGQYLRLFANNPDGTSGLHLGFNLSGSGEDAVPLSERRRLAHRLRGVRTPAIQPVDRPRQPPRVDAEYADHWRRQRRPPNRRSRPTDRSTSGWLRPISCSTTISWSFTTPTRFPCRSAGCI